MTYRNKFYHLKNNLKRFTYNESIFNNECGQKALLSIGHGDYDQWSQRLLPNTRLIVEPEIIGINIAIQYINGKLNKAINKYSEDITKKITPLQYIPKKLPIIENFEIQGVLYKNENISAKYSKRFINSDNNNNSKLLVTNFCAFHIYHCKINHYQSLKELKKLKFEVPQSECTKFISDIEIYRQCWREGKLFKSYPTSGLVLKINSRKLQKSLEENNLSLHWAYAIN
tara:strand:+ start:1690 stop:2373 length:684 start_codon:yes stop_codon:yes gene_type:complete